MIELTVRNLMKSGFTRQELKTMRRSRKGGKGKKTKLFNGDDMDKLFGKNHFLSLYIFIFLFYSLIYLIYLYRIKLTQRRPTCC